MLLNFTEPRPRKRLYLKSVLRFDTMWSGGPCRVELYAFCIYIFHLPLALGAYIDKTLLQSLQLCDIIVVRMGPGVCWKYYQIVSLQDIILLNRVLQQFFRTTLYYCQFAYKQQE